MQLKIVESWWTRWNNKKRYLRKSYPPVDLYNHSLREQRRRLEMVNTAIFKPLSINIPLIDALEQMPCYSMLIRDMVTKKRTMSTKDEDRMHNCSAISIRSLVQKKKNLSAFTIPCTIGLLHFVKAIFELGASIYRMPPSIYKKLGLYDPKPTMMRLLMDYNCEEAH